MKTSTIYIFSFSLHLCFNFCGCSQEDIEEPQAQDLSITQASQLSREAQRGTHRLADGSSYEGELAQGLPHGFGTQTFADENVYQGQFVKGVPHGHGIMRYKAVPEIDRYFGIWSNGMRGGFGTLVMSDGSELVGHWEKDSLSYGEFSSPDGSKYFGKWEGDSLTEGVYVSPLGDRFTGRFDNLGKYLTGSLQTADQKFYHGSFQDGKFHGSGILEDLDGSIYIGLFEEGTKNGTGILEDNDGTVYHGEFKLGLPNGKGVQFDPNGALYNGDWDEGRRSGKGLLDFGDGTSFSGDFENGRAIRGQYDWGDGTVTNSYQDEDGNWLDYEE